MLKSDTTSEYQARLDADRLTLELGQKSKRRIDEGRASIEESPLFGGEAQNRLFVEDGPDATHG